MGGLGISPSKSYSGMCVYALPPIKSAAAITGCSEGKFLPALNALDVAFIFFLNKTFWFVIAPVLLLAALCT